MIFHHISLWAVIALLLLLGIAIGLFSLIDKRLSLRILHTIGTAALQLVLLCACVMLLSDVNHWWSSLLCLVVMLVAAALFRLLQLHLPWKRWLLPLTLAMLAGSAVPILLLLWALTPDTSFWSPRFVLPVIALMAGHLLMSGSKALQTYHGSVLRTKEHREYLLACGATHLESIIPVFAALCVPRSSPHSCKWGACPSCSCPPCCSAE